MTIYNKDKFIWFLPWSAVDLHDVNPPGAGEDPGDDVVGEPSLHGHHQHVARPQEERGEGRGQGGPPPNRNTADSPSDTETRGWLRSLSEWSVWGEGMAEVGK